MREGSDEGNVNADEPAKILGQCMAPGCRRRGWHHHYGDSGYCTDHCPDCNPTADQEQPA